MEGLGHILEERAWAFDAHQLCTSGRATLEGDGRLATAEVTSNECEQLFVRLAVNRRRFELREPSTILGLRQEGRTVTGPSGSRTSPTISTEAASTTRRSRR